jgi:hypothetical protein
MKNKLLLIVAGASILATTCSMRVTSYPHAIHKASCRVSPSILWGIAYNESAFKLDAVSQDKQDRGWFQLRKQYDESRGVVNAFDPIESTGHAIKIIVANFKALKKTPEALAAYRQGVGSVRMNGIFDDSWPYINRIIHWSNQAEYARQEYFLVGKKKLA